MRNDLAASYEISFGIGTLVLLLMANYQLSGELAASWGTALGYVAGVLLLRAKYWAHAESCSLCKISLTGFALECSCAWEPEPKNRLAA
jgi:hypothetical protein